MPDHSTVGEVPVLDRRGPGPVQLDILMPHYEDLIGLDLSFRSIAEQTWTGKLRVVVVDDGSGPGTLEAVQGLAESQPFPVHVAAFDRNRGRQHARNRLLDEVDAPYMAWIDAGEVWYRKKLATQFEHLRRLELDGVDLDRVWVTCHYHWDQSGRVRRVLQRTTADQMADLLIGDDLRAYLWTLLGRTSAFHAAGRFDENLPRLQDLDYFIRFLEAGGEISAPPSRTPLCRYDKSDRGRNHGDVARCASHIMRKHRAAYRRYGRGFEARANWKFAKLSARYAINNRSYVAAMGYLGRVVIENPRYAAFKVRQKILT